MRTVIFAAIAALSALAPAYAADPATMGTPLTTQQCTDQLSQCTDDKCKQDFQAKHPECSSTTGTKATGN